MQHINRMKGENHMIISVDAEKAFEKIQGFLKIKTLNKSHVKGHNTIKAMYDKGTTYTKLNHKRLKNFPL